MLEKQFLEECLNKGMSTRDISKLTGVSKSNIGYLINKYDLGDLNKHNKPIPYRFENIDTPAKAYALGFILCDAGISDIGYVSINTSITNSQPVQFIAWLTGGNCNYDYKFDKKKRIFPKCKYGRRMVDILRFIGGPNKDQRHFPRLRQDLELYLMLGVFDADGCITWGRRKDRNRLWHKITIKSSFNILYGVQQFLYNKLNIPTKIYPVKNENCFVLEFSDRDRVMYFLNWLYQNPQAVILYKKYQKYCALRLELEENGGSWNQPNYTVPSLQRQEGVETTGWVAKPFVIPDQPPRE